MPILSRRCVCGREYDLLEHRGGLSALDRDDLDNLSCPSCDSLEATNLVGGGIGIELGGSAGVGKHYPRYDSALMTWIESAADRRRICKERNLIPIEGDYDEHEQLRVDRAMDREIEEGRQRLEREIENDPNRAEYRKAQDTIAERGADLYKRHGGYDHGG